MKAIVCEMCNSKDIIKQDGYYVCLYCNTKYSVEEAKKLMIDGEVSVKGINSIEEEIKNVYKLIEIGKLDKAHGILESLVSKAPRNGEVWLAYAKYSENYYLYGDDIDARELKMDDYYAHLSKIENYILYDSDITPYVHYGVYNYEILLKELEYYKKCADVLYENKFNEMIYRIVQLKNDKEKELINNIKESWRIIKYQRPCYEHGFWVLKFKLEDKNYYIKSDDIGFSGELYKTIAQNSKILREFLNEKIELIAS